ncbi:hypothetical protein Q8W37_15470 [Shimia thalassica]|uniref:hypothetical protein n=1 Tax=Shimia thalassica TaxID=1715693 RepID=UPI0027362B08|nr:hypothetical protein [Shimia thalassica]MDP2581337.1 hypothetical protein [Shimia thalassica]
MAFGILIALDLDGFKALKLNEIGDMMAGLFSGIAFVWITSAVLIQNKEFRSQREDIEVTKAANLQQGRALEQATKIESIRHLREVQEAREKYFSRKMTDLRKMLGRNLELQDTCVAYLAWKDDIRKPIVEFYNQILDPEAELLESDSVSHPIPEWITNDLSHEETVCAMDIFGFCEDIENALRPIRARAAELNLSAEQHSWEAMFGFDKLLRLKSVAERYALCAMEKYSVEHKTVAAAFMKMQLDGKVLPGSRLVMNWVPEFGHGRMVYNGDRVFPERDEID